MIGKSQGETEIPLDSAEWVPRARRLGPFRGRTEFPLTRASLVLTLSGMSLLSIQRQQTLARIRNCSWSPKCGDVHHVTESALTDKRGERPQVSPQVSPEYWAQDGR